MSEAWKAYEAKAKTPNPKRPIQTTRPNFTLELSLIYDMIRGNLKGSLGMNVDDNLDLLDNERGSKYIEKMGYIVSDMTIKKRESKDKASRKAKRKRCKSEGCGKFAWNGGDGHCYNHAGLSKRLCRKCQKRTRKYAGGLCGPCREPSTGIQEKVYCTVCFTRETARGGIRCRGCIGSSFSGSKKKKQVQEVHW